MSTFSASRGLPVDGAKGELARGAMLRGERLAQLQTQLLAMTLADAAGWIRANLASLSAEIEP